MARKRKPTPQQAIPRRKKLRAKTQNQESYIKSMNASSVTFCSGPAGSGKNKRCCWLSLRILDGAKGKKNNNNKTCR